MAITFQCDHCGKKIEAPDSAGGKRGRCPYCKQTNYIPAPVAEEDLFDMAPEDGADEARRQAELKSLRSQERDLITELADMGAPAEPLEWRHDLKPEDIYHYVVNYCLDMANSNLERAQTHVAELKKVRRTTVVAVEEFLSGKATEPVLNDIPPKLLNAFLTQLRDAML